MKAGTVGMGHRMKHYPPSFPAVNSSVAVARPGASRDPARGRTDGNLDSRMAMPMDLLRELPGKARPGLHGHARPASPATPTGRFIFLMVASWER
jgi:hypothetical protein